jgi:arylsulfatase A-like enzyme/lysophospholipase L1-like esterase
MTYLKSILLGLSLLASLTLTVFAEKSETKPNFLFIFADDHSYEAVGAYGNEEVKTPNLDLLASRGVRFTNAYNMGGWNGAVCIAARTSIMTGKSVWRAMRAESSLQQAAQNGELWPQLLSEAGYETYCTGKWHVKIDPKTIFDHHVHERPGMPKDSWGSTHPPSDVRAPAVIETLDGYNRPLEGEPDRWSPYDPSFGGFWEGGKHWSEVLADDAEAFLEHAATRDKPFFMYLAFNAPHDPRQAPKRFVDMYPLSEIRVPESYLPQYPYSGEIGLGPPLILRDEALAPYPRTEYAVKVNRQEYYAIISHMDEQIGRILKALEKTGKQDNTYIIFSADHGLAAGHHGLLGKQNMYEHSMKAPLIIVGPDVPESEKSEVLVYIQDIMATTLDLAGVPKPQYVEFNSLMPLVQNPGAGSLYDSIYGCYLPDAQRMIRVGDLKLVVYPRAKRIRLFDLKADPEEMDDLSGQPAYWSTIQDLFGKLLDQQIAKRDDLMLVSKFPDLISSYDAKSAWKKLLMTSNPLGQVTRDAYAYVERDPELPNVLLYGDSISIGYTPTTQAALKGQANVHRLHRNGSSSSQLIPFLEELHRAMQDERLKDPWDFQWDVIHFNVGLHDLKYVVDGNKLNKAEGKQVTAPQTYAQNLRKIVRYLQELAPSATLIFATTTPVPEGEPGRHAGDAAAYNQIALEVLEDFPEVLINDLFAFTKANMQEWAIVPGNVHFNELGRAKQGEQVAEVIKGQL